MLKKTIAFEDLEGTPVTGDFYFHLSIAELTEWAAQGGEPGDTLGQQVLRTVERGIQSELLAMFKDLIAKSVGEKNVDGVTFDKTPEITRKFMQTEAYSELLLELITNAGAATEFVNGIMPRKFQEKMRTLVASGKLESTEVKVPVLGGEPIVMKPKKINEYSIEDLEKLPYEAFKKLFDSANPGSLSREVLVLAFQRRNES